MNLLKAGFKNTFHNKRTAAQGYFLQLLWQKKKKWIKKMLQTMMFLPLKKILLSLLHQQTWAGEKTKYIKFSGGSQRLLTHTLMD